MKVTKEQILEKLFDGKELDQDELVFVAKNLDGGVEVKRSFMPYLHSSDNNLEACGVTEEDGHQLNIIFNQIIREKEDMCVSEMIEKLETLIDEQRPYKRLILLQQVKMAHDYNMKQQIMKKLGPLGGLLGGAIGGAGLEDLLKGLMGDQPDDPKDGE